MFPKVVVRRRLLSLDDEFYVGENRSRLQQYQRSRREGMNVRPNMHFRKRRSSAYGFARYSGPETPLSPTKSSAQCDDEDSYIDSDSEEWDCDADDELSCSEVESEASSRPVSPDSPQSPGRSGESDTAEDVSIFLKYFKLFQICMKFISFQ